MRTGLRHIFIFTACAFGLVNWLSLAEAQGVISTFAGNGIAAYSGDGGRAGIAALNHPKGLAFDAAGSLYIADVDNHRVRKVTSDGTITTVAGNGTQGWSGDNGNAVNASISDVTGVALDRFSNLYIADASNRRVRKVTPNGAITTIAGTGVEGFSGDGGPAAEAMLGRPAGLAVDAAGNLYIADSTNHRIRRIDTNGIITTVAGNGIAGFSGDDGPAIQASLQFPIGVAVDSFLNLYIADGDNNRIRKVTPSGTIRTVAGGGAGRFSGDGGPATAAALNIPEDVALDAAGNLYIADAGNNRVRKVDSNGTITTVAGTGADGFSGDGGPSTSAMLNFPWGLATNSAGYLFIADRVNSRIRVISAANNGAVPRLRDTDPVVNGASFAGGQAVAPGAIVSIFGSNLAGVTTPAPAGALPTVIGDTSITFNGVAAPLFYVSPNQVNAQAPFNLGLGTVSVQVSRGGLSGSTTANVASVSPGIFIMDEASKAGAILHANYQLVSSTAPAQAGEYVLIYATGLGALKTPVQSGVVASGIVETTGTPTVMIGGVPAQISFSGLAPGFVGLYQVNAIVPNGVQPGDQTVQISIGGAFSNVATMAVR